MDVDTPIKCNNFEQLPLPAYPPPAYNSYRVINHLPLPPLINFTPHQGLEFEPCVFDYCRNLRFNSNNNHLIKGRYNHKYFPTPTTNERATSAAIKTCKVIVSGDVAVGKTCLVNRFGHDIYTNDYQTTIGVDFDIQKFTILGQQYSMQIWDTAGLERFRCITNSYYRGCQAALLVFDLTNMSSLASIVKWKDEVLNAAKTFDQLVCENDKNQDQDFHQLKSIKSNHENNQKPFLFLVGTKCDLPVSEASQNFMREQANRIARLIGAELWFVSAQSGENVNELFNRVAALSFNRSVYLEVQRIRFEASTLGAGLKEKILQQQKELWSQSTKLIKITRKKDGDHRRSKCINIQFFIKKHV